MNSYKPMCSTSIHYTRMTLGMLIGPLAAIPGSAALGAIRRGMIVYRDGEQLREMAVERGTESPRLVRDAHPDPRTVSAATPAEPDGIDTGGD